MDKDLFKAISLATSPILYDRTMFIWFTDMIFMHGYCFLVICSKIMRNWVSSNKLKFKVRGNFRVGFLRWVLSGFLKVDRLKMAKAVVTAILRVAWCNYLWTDNFSFLTGLLLTAVPSKELQNLLRKLSYRIGSWKTQVKKWLKRLRSIFIFFDSKQNAQIKIN